MKPTLFLVFIHIAIAQTPCESVLQSLNISPDLYSDTHSTEFIKQFRSTLKSIVAKKSAAWMNGFLSKYDLVLRRLSTTEDSNRLCAKISAECRDFIHQSRVVERVRIYFAMSPAAWDDISNIVARIER